VAAEVATAELEGVDEDADAPSPWLDAVLSLLRATGVCTLLTFEIGMTMGARVAAGAATGAAA